MFESLKKKLSGLVEKITKKVDETAERELQPPAMPPIVPPNQAVLEKPLPPAKPGSFSSTPSSPVQQALPPLHIPAVSAPPSHAANLPPLNVSVTPQIHAGSTPTVAPVPKPPAPVPAIHMPQTPSADKPSPQVVDRHPFLVVSAPPPPTFKMPPVPAVQVSPAPKVELLSQPAVILHPVAPAAEKKVPEVTPPDVSVQYGQQSVGVEAKEGLQEMGVVDYSAPAKTGGASSSSAKSERDSVVDITKKTLSIRDRLTFLKKLADSSNKPTEEKAEVSVVEPQGFKPPESGAVILPAQPHSAIPTVDAKTNLSAEHTPEVTLGHTSKSTPSRAGLVSTGTVQDATASVEKPKSLKERILGVILETEISGSDLEGILSEFEVDLLENDVALEVVERMLADMHASLKGKKVRRGDVENVIKGAIRAALEGILSKGKGIDLLEEIKKAEKPYKVVFVGINGTGKTTTIAKIANLCQQNGFEPVIAASDTFRAASIEQLEAHAQKLGVKLVKHKYGSDAAAVAYDAIEHAKAKGKPVVLIDTAGRMQTNANLMDELRKILRVADPNLVIFVGDSLTGNDAVEQARTFNEVRVDAVILTKSDADAKGGACLSISYAIGKPVLYLGTGQNYSDLVKFTPEWFMEKVGA